MQICSVEFSGFGGISGYTCLTVFGANIFYIGLWIKTHVEQSITCQKKL